MTRLLLALLILTAVAPAAAQQPERADSVDAPAADAQVPETRGAATALARSAHDPALELLRQARAARRETGSSIVAYDAVISRRMQALLRLPLKDRLLVRREQAARVRWSRDGETVVHLLAGRHEDPSGVAPAPQPDLDAVFDPAADRVYFGSGLAELTDEGENFWIAHPLAEEHQDSYRYAIGDSMTLRLPDGRLIRAIELRVAPRHESFHYLLASLWIEPVSGAVVRAVFRPSRTVDLLRDTVFIDAEDIDAAGRVPGFLRPFQIEFDLIAIEYSLWDFEHWLPHRMSIEGHGRAGIVRVPVTVETSYAIRSVIDEDDVAAPATPTPDEVLASWGVPHAVTRDTTIDAEFAAAVFVPEDQSLLLQSDHLPAPIGEDSPAFAGQEDLRPLVERLEHAMGRGSARPTRLALEWGAGGAGLVRFNRVEGLSLGIRGTAYSGHLTTTATVRLGLADLHPNVDLTLTFPTRRATLGVSAYHRLDAVEGGSALGFGNSFGALVFGRDDGDYYRATGVAISVLPPQPERAWLQGSVWAERQQPVDRQTDWSLPRLFDSDHRFRPNLEADESDLLGLTLTAAPWWGVSPRRPQGGIELFTQAAAGDHRFARTRLTARTSLPLVAEVRLAAEAAIGTSWGDLPAQHAWFIGGPETLRGYGGAAAVGPDMARARMEIAHGSRGAAYALFADAGWAGEHDAFESDSALLSVGAGVTVLDGLFRLDLAHALREPRGWRLDVRADTPF